MAQWTILSFQAGLIAALVCSLTGYLGQFHPYLELTSHFKVQYFTIGCIAFIFFCFKRKRSEILISLCCVLLNLAVILPWYFPASPVANMDVATSTRLRVLLANVNVKNQTYAPAIELIQRLQPDLFAIIETNRDWLRELEAVKASYPYTVRSPNAEGFGIALYSKFPLSAQTIAAPPEAKDFHVIATASAGRPIAVIALHPPPPKNQTLSEQRNQELAAISRYIQTLTLPVIVIGDFNTTLWSPYYQEFTQSAGLKDCRQGFGVLPTWTTRMPLLYIPIDHCLVSSEISVVNTQTEDNIASDHLPVMTELVLPPE